MPDAPASRALFTVDARGGTRTVFQSTSLASRSVAVPVRCDRAGTAEPDGVEPRYGPLWLSAGWPPLPINNDAP